MLTYEDDPMKKLALSSALGTLWQGLDIETLNSNYTNKS